MAATAIVAPIVALASIPTWSSYFRAHKLVPELLPEQDEKLFSPEPSLNEKISIFQGDLTTLEVDAIVNAANEQLRPGGGVCGVIHDKAGPELKKACQDVGNCPSGESRITDGFNLPANHVIHTVGPQGELPKVLSSAYQSTFRTMIVNNLRTIAIPCISTGIYGYPPDQAAHIALLTTRHFLRENGDKVDRIIFTTYLDSDKKIYEELMQRYFPVE